MAQRGGLSDSRGGFGVPTNCAILQTLPSIVFGGEAVQYIDGASQQKPALLIGYLLL